MALGGAVSKSPIGYPSARCRGWLPRGAISEWPVSSTTGGTSCSAVFACFAPFRIRASASVSIQVTTAMVESCLLARSYRLRTLIFPNSFLDLSAQITEGTSTLPAFALRVPRNPEILGQLPPTPAHLPDGFSSCVLTSITHLWKIYF